MDLTNFLIHQDMEDHKYKHNFLYIFFIFNLFCQQQKISFSIIEIRPVLEDQKLVGEFS